jgi:orotate phosphoribosyltransferase
MSSFATNKRRPLLNSMSTKSGEPQDDVINAGSALLSTLSDLLDCGIELAGFAALLTLGEAAAQIAQQYGVSLFALALLERGMWVPEECPLCRSGVSLNWRDF